MCLKVAKNIDLERSHRRKELSLRVVVGISQTYCDDHVTVYTNIESSCCPPGSNVSYASFIAKEREKEHTEQKQRAPPLRSARPAPESAGFPPVPGPARVCAALPGLMSVPCWSLGSA